jgi:chromosome segregation ATPase
MGYWLGGTIIVLAIGLGIVGQRYYESDQTDNQQALTITDLNQQIRGMRGDIATTASLKAQLAAAQRDADSARANVKSLEDQVRGDAESLSSQLAGRDQTIDQQRAELQQQQSQIQQLAQADSQTTAQLNQLRAQNGAANYPQQSVSPIVQPMYSVPIYATHNVVEAESLEANTFAQVQAASNRVNQLTLTLRSQFEASPQYLQAKSDLNAAKSTYDATLAVVIGDLATDPNYKSAVDAKATAQKAVDDAREHGADTDTISGLAQASLAANTAVTNMENAAEISSSDFQDAKAKLASARGTMRQAEEQYQTSLMNDAALAQARMDFDTANANHAAAMANLQALDKDRADREAAERQAEMQAQVQSWTNQNQNNDNPQPITMRAH